MRKRVRRIERVWKASRIFQVDPTKEEERTLDNEFRKVLQEVIDEGGSIITITKDGDRKKVAWVIDHD